MRNPTLGVSDKAHLPFIRKALDDDPVETFDYKVPPERKPRIRNGKCLGFESDDENITLPVAQCVISEAKAWAPIYVMQGQEQVLAIPPPIQIVRRTTKSEWDNDQKQFVSIPIATPLWA